MTKENKVLTKVNTVLSKENTVLKIENTVLTKENTVLTSSFTSPHLISPVHVVPPQMLTLARTPFQGIATMTYTKSHTRPSQKDLGCVVYPLNNRSLLCIIIYLIVNKSHPTPVSAEETYTSV